MKEVFKSVISHILAFEARLLLKRKRPKIIAITGNVGKTSTKDAIYTVIRQHVRARKSEKSFNSDIGVPLTILGLPNAWGNVFGWIHNILEGLVIALFAREYPEWLVLEMGVDRPGDMKRLAALAKPDIVVLTRFPDVPVHVEYFSSPEAVITEKMELVHALAHDGIVVFNNDDDNIRKALKGVDVQTIGYSRQTPAPYQGMADRVIYEGTIPKGAAFMLSHGQESAPVEILGSLGTHSAYSAAAAAAVGGLLGVSLKDAAKDLHEHDTPPGRMKIIAGKKDFTIIDDTYNASPLAMEQALETLGSLVHAKRRIAVLGDMLELGRFSVKEHEKVGRFLAGKVDALMTVGIRARSIATSAHEAGLKETRILEAQDADSAAEMLEKLLKPGDAVLVKGSQSMRMERVVRSLMAEPEKAGELLVRQDTIWNTK